MIKNRIARQRHRRRRPAIKMALLNQILQCPVSRSVRSVNRGAVGPLDTIGAAVDRHLNGVKPMVI